MLCVHLLAWVLRRVWTIITEQQTIIISRQTIPQPTPIMTAISFSDSVFPLSAGVAGVNGLVGEMLPSVVPDDWVVLPGGRAGVVVPLVGAPAGVVVGTVGAPAVRGGVVIGASVVPVGVAVPPVGMRIGPNGVVVGPAVALVVPGSGVVLLVDMLTLVTGVVEDTASMVMDDIRTELLSVVLSVVDTMMDVVGARLEPNSLSRTVGILDAGSNTAVLLGQGDIISPEPDPDPNASVLLIPVKVHKRNIQNIAFSWSCRDVSS